PRARPALARAGRRLLDSRRGLPARPAHHPGRADRAHGQRARAGARPRRPLPAAADHDARADLVPAPLVPAPEHGGARAAEPGARERAAEDAARRHESRSAQGAAGALTALRHRAAGVPRGGPGAGSDARAGQPPAAAAAAAPAAGVAPARARQAPEAPALAEPRPQLRRQLVE